MDDPPAATSATTSTSRTEPTDDPEITACLELVFGSRAETLVLGYFAELDDPGQPQRQYTIANAIEMSEATVSRMVKKFEDLGVLEQVPGGVQLVEPSIAENLADLSDAIDIGADPDPAGG